MSERARGEGWVRVPGGAALAVGACRSFAFTEAGYPALGFLLRHGERLLAYRNRCPHWGVDLDLGAGDPYVADLDRILCRNHGALFLPDSGLCEWGPCAGRSLQAFHAEVDGDDVWVRIV